ncbi:MAG TPA: hypothetical protein VFT08_03700, partial [Pyrinomonadaceae bacterium]|nr:hypothetical protein [Pyrinomonadaceae bacterium]
IRESFSSKLVGYSNADIEAVILLANEDAARESVGKDGDAGASDAGGAASNGGGASDAEAPVLDRHFLRAAVDYFPSRDQELLDYMELLAVFESSSRRLLSAKYASLTPEDLDARLRHLRAIVGNRR